MGGLLLGAIALGLSACGTSDEPRRGDPPSDYAAVPDEDLFDAVRSLPRVRSADLTYVDQLGESNTYRATVRLGPGREPAEVSDVFDRVVEVLRHGRWRAAMVVTVVSGDVVDQDGGHDLFTGEDYEEFYGPQTGQAGWPPDFLPAR